MMSTATGPVPVGSGPGGGPEVDAATAVGRLIDRRHVGTLFQPLVHLTSGEVVGFEALTRGPAGGPLEAPIELFAAARRAGRLGELDWLCRATALRRATAADLAPGISWFVNVEPAALATDCPPDLSDDLRAARPLRVVTELTEREVDRDPARLLRAAAAARRAGWGVALDDVGAVPRSLALLPFVQPDVVKLDMSLLGDRDRAEVAAVANGVRAYAERTGAAVLAEGIETADQERAALVLGATYGQGWRYGRPGSLPSHLGTPRAPVPFGQRVPAEESTSPFEVLAAHRPPIRATKGLLLPTSHHLERQALVGGESLVLLACFQRAEYFTAGTRRRFAGLARRNVLTMAMAAGLRDGPGCATGPTGAVREVGLPADDPMVHEWDVAVVGPHFAGALAARDLGDAGPDRDRRFDYVITFDRDLVLRVARLMLSRVTES